MISLDHPADSARRLLRMLRRRPHQLERDALALHLREVLHTPSCREALVEIIDRTFAVSDSADDRSRREILIRCDVRGEKARAAAAAMHVSLRQFYRRRSEAFEALALVLERADELEPSAQAAQPPVYCASCHRRIFETPRYALSEPKTAT